MFGTWRPGRFPPVITLVAKLVLMALMAIRGADYAFTNPDTASRLLTEVESAAPLHWWGFAFIGASALGFTGIILRRPTPIVWAHILGAAMYAALAVGIVIDVAHRAHDPAAGAWPALAALTLAVGLLLASRAWARHQPLLMPLAALCATTAVAATSVGMTGLRSATILAGVATLHLLMALGTAARARQATLREKRPCE